MGAWGYGMRDNDSALDYIWGFQKQSIRYLHEEIVKWKKTNRYRCDAFDTGKSILGLAEIYLNVSMFDYITNKRIPKVINGLKLIANHQLKNLDSWKEPWRRKKALLTFLSRLDKIES